MKTILKQLSTVIAKMRRHQGLSQAELAEQAGVSLKTLGNIETAIDKHDIGIQKLSRILDTLNIELVLKAPTQNAPIIEPTYKTHRHPTIRLDVYPQLKLLAWNRANKQTINEADAFDLYEQNWRYIDEVALTDKEQKFIEKLTQKYGQGVMHV